MSMINEFVEKLRGRLKKELQLADEDKRKADVLQFDRVVGYANGMGVAIDILNQLEEEYKDVPDTNVGKWIPVSEKLPENTDPVNITWVNHKPAPYYADIKDKPFTATGCYCDGKWYWYSAVCQAYLDEYRYSENDYMDNEVEVTAWMPLPESYEGE